jgi:ubiquitin-like protein ATG12
MSDTDDRPIPDEQSPQQLVPLSASVILTHLPRDSTAILDKYENPPGEKITIRFRAIGSTPMLQQTVYRISSNQKFSVLVKFLRRQLKFTISQALFCYINSSFAPGLDEMIGNLYNSFAIDGQLLVSYCTTVAFG